jgi:hypothetical protein
MTYLPMGDVASSEFNATKYPGVCKPSTNPTLLLFRELQSQLNRVASVSGLTPIAIDGDIGPGTVALYAREKPFLAVSVAPIDAAAAIKVSSASTCSQIATVADIIARVAKNYADSQKAPAVVPGPAPTRPPTLVNAKGEEFAAPPPGKDLFVQIFGRPLSTMEKVAVIGVFGGIGYLVYTNTKKRKRGRR